MPLSAPPSALVKCGEMPLPEDPSVDSHSINQGEMTDWGKDCALKHNTLVDSVNQHNKEAVDGR